MLKIKPEKMKKTVFMIISIVLTVIFITGLVTVAVGNAKDDQFIKKYQFEEYSETSELNDFVMCKAVLFVPLFKESSSFSGGHTVDTGGYGLIMTENGDLCVIYGSILDFREKGTINGYDFDYSQLDFLNFGYSNNYGIKECSTYIFGKIVEKKPDYDFVMSDYSSILQGMNEDTDILDAIRESNNGSEELLNKILENNVISLYTQDYYKTKNTIKETGELIINIGLVLVVGIGFIALRVIARKKTLKNTINAQACNVNRNREKLLSLKVVDHKIYDSDNKCYEIFNSSDGLHWIYLDGEKVWVDPLLSEDADAWRNSLQ